jgi:hypothetical protein
MERQVIGSDLKKTMGPGESREVGCFRIHPSSFNVATYIQINP